MLSCFLLLGLFNPESSNAQVYPVRVTPQIIPPYDLKLASYATTGTEKLYINLLLADINEQGRQVRLKMSIEGQGLNIQNPDFVAGATPILLDGGVNLRLSNLDLQPYFSLNNLQGITAQQYNQPLPDGLYNFCFEVFDFNTGRLISQKSCTSAFLVLNDPPILNVPGKNELVLAQLPQNVVFTWTPRHLNATNVEYEFTLKEIWDGGMDPRAAFQSSPVFQQITTQATTLLYGPSEVQMIEGKTYAWQVRALVNDGISEASIFRNNGLSEISWFNYTSECQPPAYVLSEAKSSQSVLISWQNMEHLRYDIQYRKFGSTSEEDWFSQSSYSDQLILHNLEPGTKYQFRVGGECTAGQGFSYSQIRTFTTPTNDEEAYYNCGVVPTIEITNYEPLPDLNIGEVFTAGDFPVTVKAVRGSHGIFSGWGFIVVPYLGDTKIKVAFENININTDFQMTQGIVETDYDPEWENVDFVDEVTEILEGDNDLKEVSVDFDITEEDITVNEDGSITIDDPNSDISIDYAGEDDVVIKDKSGDVFHIDDEGNVTKGGTEAEGGSVDNVSTDGINPQGEVSAITAPGIRVTFTSGNYKYGFDEIPSSEKGTLRNEYKHVADSEGNDYFFVHKAVKNGETDQIKGKVEILDNDISIDDLVIKTKQGEEISYSVQGDEITLDLRGHYTFENEEIIATIQPKEGTTDKETVAGSFTLWHMSEKEANVTIVPVNGVSLPSATALQESLNNIYGKAIVKLNVSVAPSYTLPSSTYGGDHIAMDDSGLLANYTTEQQAVIRHYKQNGPYNPDAYYLFVFGGDVQPDRSEVAGFMPIGRQFGFVFSNNLHALEGGKTSLPGTMAHELGHGIFGLSHPFDQYGTTQKGTPWLMDYSENGFSFSHMDWAQIHNPDLKFYVFQDEDEGEFVSIPNIPEEWWKEKGYIDPLDAGFIDGSIEMLNASFSMFEYILLRLGGLGATVTGPKFFGKTSASVMGMHASRIDEPIRELVTNPAMFKKLIPELKGQLIQWSDDISGLDPEAQYLQGKLIFEAVTFFVGIGEAKAILKGGQSSVGLLKLTKATNKNASTFFVNTTKKGIKLDDLLKGFDANDIKNLSDDFLDEKFFRILNEQPELVDAWSIVKKTGFDDLAKNTDVLAEVSKLSAKTLDGKSLDVATLFDIGLAKTLDKVSDVDKTKILSRINEWDASKVDDLARRLGKDNYPNLADDLADPDFFKLYDDIVNDPENALDIAKKAGDGNLTTTAKSTFFNDITKLGKDFEKVVAPALKPGGAWRTKLKTLVKNKFGVDDLDSYEMYKQVQFTYNKSTGDYFVSDQVFVKYGFDADGDKFIENIIVVENKLSDGTKLTGNQSAARSVSEYTVRSRQFVELSQGLEVKSNKWLRAYGDGSGKNIVDITDEFK